MGSARGLSLCQVVLLFAILMGHPEASLAAVGRTPGTASVTPTGAANYTIPISLPPGRNNLAPRLSLVYDHRNGDSLLGVGFAVAGFSTITRCNRSIAQDGVMQEPSLASADGYCLDGQRLRLASGTYGAAGSTYQRELHDFERVTAIGAAAGGPASWEVYQRDGLIYEYGNTGDSYIETVGSSVARVWALSRIRDRSGNYIEFTYTEDTANGAYRPNEIRYTGHLLAAAATKVVFVYEAINRPDPRYAYRYGSGGVDAKIYEYKRLDRIDVIYIPTGATIRTIDFTYESAGGAGNRSRLASIQECVAGDCLASTTLQWINGTPGWSSEVSTGQTTYGSIVIDINGDGRDDVLYSSTATPGSGTWYFMLASDSGFGSPINTGISNVNFLDARPTDWDGDAYGDILVPCSGAVNWCVMQSTGVGFAAPVDTAAVLNGAANLTLNVDIDGDSRDDLVRIITGSLPHRLGARLRSGTGFAAETIAWTAPTNDERLPYNFAGELFNQHSSHLRRRDYNGDGREDFALRVLHNSGEPGVPDTAYQHIFYGKTSVIINGGNFTTGSYQGLPGDFNGDGLTDLVQVVTGGCGIRYGRGMGLSSVVPGPACVGLPFVIDYDADGLSDLLINNGSATWKVSRSTGNGWSALIDTGLPVSTGEQVRIADVNGDGLQDIVSIDASNVWRYRMHAGVMPDYLDRVTDGYGVFADFDYQRINSPTACYNNFNGYDSGPVTPGARAYLGPMYVVCSMSASDGIGGSYTVSHSYSLAFMHDGGRGFLGFREKRTQDSRDNILYRNSYRLIFPYVGQPYISVVYQPGGMRITETYHSPNSFSSTYNGETRYFVYESRSSEDVYAVSPTHNGALMKTIETTNTVDVNSGVVTATTVSVREGENGNGLGESTNFISTVSHPTLFNDFANWCIGRPMESQETRSSDAPYAGPALTRTSTTTWEGVSCRPTQTIREPGNAQYQVTTDYDYDDFGNVDLVTVTPASGQGQAPRVTAMYWGATGRFPETITNPKSQITTFAWDPVLGVRTGVTDPNNDTVTTQYDEFGRIERETRADDTATDYVLAWCSASTCPTEDSNLRTLITNIERDTANVEVNSSYSYLDQFDRTTWLQAKVLSGALSTTRLVYNARGLVAQQSMPYLATDPIWYTTMLYDLLGRQTSITRPKHEGDLSDHQTSIVYAGLRTLVTNGRGYTTQEVRNAVGQIVETIDAGNNRTAYWYDPFDNPVRIRDAANNATLITYNHLGMKLSSVDPDMGTWTYSYYPLGELKAQTDAKLQTTTFTYDELSRLLTRVEAEGTTNFGYDTGANAIGRLSSASSPGGYQETYQYDDDGRPSQTNISITESGVTTTYSYNFGYNSVTGLQETLTYPTSSSGFRLQLLYSYQNGMLQAINNYTGGVLGTAYWTAQGMNARGQIVLENYGNGLVTSSGYDRITGWLDDRTTGPGAGTSIQNLSYLWDENRNLTQRQDLGTGNTETFQYDALDRMYQQNRNGSSLLTVGYNAIGNITSKTGVGTYTYHATKKHAVTSTTGALNNTYQYDANGNMTSRNGQPTTWYSYNLPNTINSSTASVQFSYGPNRDRWKLVRTASGGSPGSTYYIGPYLERIVASSVNEFRHYIYGPTGPIAVYKRNSAGTATSTAYISTDNLGSMDAVSSSAGVQSVNMGFNAFGERKGADGISAPSVSDETAYRNVTRRGFTFHENLDDPSVIHMNGRVYDPVIGRFMSADPFVQAPFFSQSLNRYSYVFNNPLSFTDPSGYQSAADGGGDEGGGAYISFSFSRLNVMWDRSERHAPFRELRALGGVHFADCGAPSGGIGGGHCVFQTNQTVARSLLWSELPDKLPRNRTEPDRPLLTANPVPFSSADGLKTTNQGNQSTVAAAPLREHLADAWDDLKYNVQCMWTCQWPGNDDILGVLVLLPEFQGAAAVPAGGSKIYAAGIGWSGSAFTKAVNMPAWRKVTVDMVHIADRHIVGGRTLATRAEGTFFPSTMNEASVMRAIREAYESSTKIGVQGDRVKLVGEGAGLNIEMWFNRITKTIETAYPVTK
jgi:RHS repeat-associated protein